MSDVDPAIERIEAELSASRFQPWDVETFLANRHRAKIEALTGGEVENPLFRWWVVVREIFNAFAWYVGIMAIVTIAGLWALLGEFPIHRDMIGHDAYFHRMEPSGLVPPPPAPPAIRVDAQ